MSATKDPTAPLQSTTAPDQSVCYTALRGPRFIRLLKFEGASIRSRTPVDISFTLEQYDLDQCPPYKAVSYVWGQPYRSLDTTQKSQEAVMFDHEIWINGAPFVITKNMWDAIVATFAHAAPKKHIWLDGCCINQSDLSERETQVLLMGSIYEGASEVVAFLGPLHPDLDSFHWLLLDFMPQISRLFLEGDTSIPEQSLWTLRDRITTDTRHFEASLVGAYRFYYSCRWFFRAWIKQEVVLARKVVLICGRSQLPLEAIYLVAVLFVRAQWSMELFEYKYQNLHPFVSSGFLCDAFHDWRGFMEYRQNVVRAKSFEDEILLPCWNADSKEKLEYAWLLEYVLSVRKSNCSDPRDKIFSILGLVTKQWPTVAPDLKPDYRRTTASIFTSFIELVINQLGTLNFLAFMEDSLLRVTVDLPSWVPDLAVNGSMYGHTLIVKNNLFSRVLEDFSSFQKISCCDGELHFSGIFVDIVEAVQIEANLNRHSSTANILSLLNLCKPCLDYGTYQNRVEVLWRTCIRDMYAFEGIQIPQRPAPAETATSFKAYILRSFCESLFKEDNDEGIFETELYSTQNLLHEFTSEIANKQLPSMQMILQAAMWFVEAGEHLLYDIRDPVEDSGDECRDWIRWLKATVRGWEKAVRDAQTSQNRCFRTGKHKLGSAGPDIRVGDEIWFAPSSSLPLVLRPICSNGIKTFQFVSVAYLHGMMDGELLQESSHVVDRMESLVLK